MKLLKLDARFEDARRVARCLAGSQTKGNATFLCVDISRCFVIAEIGYMGTLNIELPLDTLKFCPFVAMREGVEVFHQETNQCGLIESIICGREVWLTKEGDESSVPFGVNNLKLGLYQIERGELEGCEIVEVGE